MQCDAQFVYSVVEWRDRRNQNVQTVYRYLIQCFRSQFPCRLNILIANLQWTKRASVQSRNDKRVAICFVKIEMKVAIIVSST